MTASDRRSDVRSVGKTQIELIDDQMKRLRDMRAKLSKTQEEAVDGDRA